MSEVRVSVLMTSYNGAQFIEKQIVSILNSLSENDELIISDDGSKDNSISIINVLQEKDKRIKLLKGPCKGLNANIEYLLSSAKGEYIFISDQDDRWYENKVDVIIDYFQKNPDIDVIHHNALLIDGNDVSMEKTVYDAMTFSKSLVKFLVKSHIFGSMMAMRRRFTQYDIVPSKNCYDAGIACYAMRKRRLLFIPDVLMEYRRHGNNLSTFKRRKMSIIIKERFHLVVFVLTKVLFLKKRR